MSSGLLGAALLLAGLLASGCGDDKTPGGFECECEAGQACRDGVCVDLDVGGDAAADVREEFVDNPDCPGSGIVISEFVPRPAAGEPDWVEILGPADRDLTGFRLVGINGSGGAEYMNVGLEGGLGSSGRFVIASSALTGADQLNADLDMQTGPDNLHLLDCAGQIVDAVGYGDFGGEDVFVGEGTAAPAPGQGDSVARCPGAADTNDNGADFHLADEPTAGAENDNFVDAFACEPCVGGTFDDLVVISEVLYDADGSDTVDNEFLELKASPGLDLFGLGVEWVNGSNREVYMSLVLDAVVADDGLYVIGGPGGDVALPGTMQNDEEGIRLVDCEGSVVDALGYGDFGTEDPLGEGSPAPDVSGGTSLARCPDGSDTDNNAVDFYPAAPTPGLTNANYEDLLVCGGTGCATGLLAGRLAINEIVPGTDGFIELKGDANIGLSLVTIEVLDGTGAVAETLDLEGSTTPLGFFIVDTDLMANEGGTIRLLDCEDVEVDALAWGTGTGLAGEGDPAAAPAAGQGLARCPDGANTDDNATDYHLVDTPTEGTENSGFVDAEACAVFECESGLLTGNVIINELLVDPVGADGDYLTFIELRGVPGTVLEEAKLIARASDTGNNTDEVALLGEIPADGLFVVGQNPDNAAFSPDISSDFADLVNTAGGVDLVDCEGVVVDALAYGTGAADLGEGTRAPRTGGNAGESLARCATDTLADADTGDNLTDFHIAASPTPGAANVGIGPACGEPVCDPGAFDGHILINEMVPGTGGFIELKGDTSLTLDTLNVEALDGTGTVLQTWALIGTDATDASGFFFIDTDVLPATGGSIRLVDCAAGVVDALAWGTGTGLQGEGTAAPAPAAGQGLARCEDLNDTDVNANDFRLVTTPTKGLPNANYVDPNACEQVSPLKGVLFINELMVDPVGGDGANRTFIELRGTPTTDLTGLELVARARDDGDVTDQLELAGTVPGDELFVVGQDPSDATFATDIADQVSDFADLTNVGAWVQLVDTNDLVIDSIAYGEVTTPIGDDSPAPRTGNNAGESLARCPVATIGEIVVVNSATDFKIATTPTPGTPNTGICE